MFEKRLTRPNAPDPTGLPPVPHAGAYDPNQRIMLNRNPGPFKDKDVLRKKFKEARAGGICLFDCLYQSLKFVDRVATEVAHLSDWMQDQRAYLQHIRNAEDMRNFICDCILEDKAYYENSSDWNKYIIAEWKNVPAVRREGRDDLAFDECIKGYTSELNMRGPKTFGSDLEIDQASRTFGVVIYKYTRDPLKVNELESSFLFDTCYPSEEVQASHAAFIENTESPQAELFKKTPRWILVYKPADNDRPDQLGNHYDYMLPKPPPGIQKRGSAPSSEPPSKRWWEREEEDPPKDPPKSSRNQPVNLAALNAARLARRAEHEAAAEAAKEDERAAKRLSTFRERLMANRNRNNP